MDAIEQMLKQRADELEEIVGSEVSLQCILTRPHQSQTTGWFSWWVIGQYSNDIEFCFSKRSYPELKTYLQRRVDEINDNNATSQQKAALNEILLAL